MQRAAKKPVSLSTVKDHKTLHYSVLLFFLFLVFFIWNNFLSFWFASSHSHSLHFVFWTSNSHKIKIDIIPHFLKSTKQYTRIHNGIFRLSISFLLWLTLLSFHPIVPLKRNIWIGRDLKIDIASLKSKINRTMKFSNSQKKTSAQKLWFIDFHSPATVFVAFRYIYYVYVLCVSVGYEILFHSTYFLCLHSSSAKIIVIHFFPHFYAIFLRILFILLSFCFSFCFKQVFQDVKH